VILLPTFICNFQLKKKKDMNTDQVVINGKISLEFRFQLKFALHINCQVKVPQTTKNITGILS